MRNALIATAALIAGACVAVFTLANAIADHSWIVAGMMVGVVGFGICRLANAASGTGLSQQAVEPPSSSRPSRLQSLSQGALK